MDDIDETVLTIPQRMKRAQHMRAREPRLERAREIAKSKPANADKIRRRAFAQARQIVRTRYAGKYGGNYADLSPSEKIAIDKAIDKKQALIKKLAMRLIPKMKRKDQQRLASFLHGAPLKNIPTKTEETMKTLNDLFTEEFKKKKVDKTSDPIKILNRFDGKVTDALSKKAEKSGLCVETLGKVFIRGLKAWNEETGKTPEQYAFARVNSFISGGKTFFKEDSDLVEAKTNHTKSSNPLYGYNGYNGGKTEEEQAAKYKIMHGKVKSYLMKKGHLKNERTPNIVVKHFLDSGHGRHLVDDDSERNIEQRFVHFKKNYNPRLFEDTINEISDETKQNYKRKAQNQLDAQKIFYDKEHHAKLKKMNPDSPIVKGLDRDAETIRKRTEGLKKLKEEYSVGDNVHLGFGAKGGAGFKGKITKIDGDYVHVRSHYNGKEYRGPSKFLTADPMGHEANKSSFARKDEIKKKIIDEMLGKKEDLTLKEAFARPPSERTLKRRREKEHNSNIKDHPKGSIRYINLGLHKDSNVDPNYHNRAVKVQVSGHHLTNYGASIEVKPHKDSIGFNPDARVWTSSKHLHHSEDAAISDKKKGPHPDNIPIIRQAMKEGYEQIDEAKTTFKHLSKPIKNHPHQDFLDKARSIMKDDSHLKPEDKINLNATGHSSDEWIQSTGKKSEKTHNTQSVVSHKGHIYTGPDVDKPMRLDNEKVNKVKSLAKKHGFQQDDEHKHIMHHPETGAKLYLHHHVKAWHPHDTYGSFHLRTPYHHFEKKLDESVLSENTGPFKKGQTVFTTKHPLPNTPHTGRVVSSGSTHTIIRNSAGRYKAPHDHFTTDRNESYLAKTYTKEEMEGLDELSAHAIDNYIHAAKPSYQELKAKSDKAWKEVQEIPKKQDLHKYQKAVSAKYREKEALDRKAKVRSDSLAKAMTKVVKEEVKTADRNPDKRKGPPSRKFLSQYKINQSKAGDSLNARGDGKLRRYDEEVRTADKEPVVIPAHKDAYGNTIKAKTVMRKVNKKILDTGNVHDGEDQ